jgi:hypothetical protein
LRAAAGDFHERNGGKEEDDECFALVRKSVFVGDEHKEIVERCKPGGILY